MGTFLSDRELEELESAEGAFASQVPTQMVSNGEFTPLPQTPQQKQVEGRLTELADKYAPKQGLDRRSFLRSACGMAAAFVAMNEVFGPVFDVSEAEAANRDMTLARASGLSHQFILDDQTHFVHDNFKQEGLLGLGKFASENWNKDLKPEQLSLLITCSRIMCGRFSSISTPKWPFCRASRSMIQTGRFCPTIRSRKRSI